MYAGYSVAQLSSLVEHIKDSRIKIPIFDPMSGQAFALSTLTWYGHEVRINDINPAPLLLAWIRSAYILWSLEKRAAEFKIWLQDNKYQLDKLHQEYQSNIPFITGWLSTSMTEQLQLYGHLAIDGSKKLNLVEIGKWDESILFRLALLVLAARRLTCHAQSDNRTWLKPGGLDNKPRLSDAIFQELDVLTNCSLVSDCRNEVNIFGSNLNKLELSCTDISQTDLPIYRKKCITITSPPYANRLDYSVMWGPELWVLSTALPFINRETVKLDQIGTTKIRHEDDNAFFNQLPLNTRIELEQIEKSPEYASKSYYYPFFRQFAQDLYTGLQHSIKSAPKSEKWIIFIRDTARKDVMFSSHAICEAVLNSYGYKRRKQEDLQIIRNHIGLMRRKQTSSSIHGMAQREWWLVFDREGN